MARIRSIKPEFFDDYEFISNLPRDLRLYYVALWVRCCDDRGCLPDVAPWIAKETFPYDVDVTPQVIQEWNDRLLELGRLVRYEADGKRYLCVWHFLDHQKIDRPSKSTVNPIPDSWRFDEASWKWIERPDHTPRGVNGPSSSPHRADAESVGERPATQDSTIAGRTLVEPSSSPRRVLALGSGSRIKDLGAGAGSRARVREATPPPDPDPISDMAAEEAAAAGEVDGDSPLPREVCKFYEVRLGCPLGPALYDELRGYFNRGMPATVLIEAIDEAANGDTPDALLRTILRTWKQKGIDTLEKAKARREGRKNGAPRASPSPPGGGEEGAPNAGAYQEVDPDAVRRWKELYPQEVDTG